jgi:hypothetical protein
MGHGIEIARECVHLGRRTGRADLEGFACHDDEPAE